VLPVEAEAIQYAEPEVSQIKFLREIQGFEALQDDWRAKGVFLVKEEFPVAEFIFVAAKIRPASVVFSIRIDFTNYDVEPASIKFIDPFNRAILKRKDIPINFWQFKMPESLNINIPAELQVQKQDLLQGAPEVIPFFCVPGVKEYHDHPYHTGDSWFLYRNTGIGNLNNLLDQLYNHSIVFINGHNVTLTPAITGFNQILPVTAPPR
jgi:hypothetical protein